jgi:hypothetical protein
MNGQNTFISLILLILLTAGVVVYIKTQPAVLSVHTILSPSSVSKPLETNNQSDRSESPEDRLLRRNTARNESIAPSEPSQLGQVSPTLQKQRVLAGTDTLQERLAANPAAVKVLLSDVTGGSGSGTGYILRENGQLFHTLTVSLPPVEGTEYFYQGWLVKEYPRRTFFSTGRLRLLDDGRYFIALNAAQQYEGFDFVVVSIEQIEDGTPERHVLEGTATQ